MPTHPARARRLLRNGRAAVARRYPFTIRLKDVDEGETQDIELKIDPGASTTGIAAVRSDGVVLHLAEIRHRGGVVQGRVQKRASLRRRRRSANLRYRKKRFDNRTRPKGWLPPSLQSRVDNVLNWTSRYRRLMPVAGLAVERVRFDTQALQDPEITGVEYQHGTLHGYELREYLLEKWGRICVYCRKTGVPLEIEHIHPRSRGGSDRASNLTLACRPCNQTKDNQRVEDFLSEKPALLRRIKAGTKVSLSGAAAMNATRNSIYRGLARMGLPLQAGSGGRTKFNRHAQGIPKSHALDAACVGQTLPLKGWNQPVLAISATGRGSYCRTRVTRQGFPRGYLLRAKSVQGFQTGDMVHARVPHGKKAGSYIGRVAVRKTGSFNITTLKGKVDGISARYCCRISRMDGYSYQLDKKDLNATAE